MEEMQWVLPEIAAKSVAVAYRQSIQFHELAKKIVVQSGGDATDVVLPDFVDNESVAPVLATNLSQQDDVDWLAGRIVEIENFVQQLPSILSLEGIGDVLEEDQTECDVLVVGRLLPRSLSAAAQRCVSNPRFAPLPFCFFVGDLVTGVPHVFVVAFSRAALRLPGKWW